MKKGITALSSGASVAAQAARRKAERGEPKALPTERLEHGTNSKTGMPTYFAVFPQAGGGEPRRIDISFMLDFPNLAELFGPAFLAYGSSLKPASARTMAGQLRCGFFTFISLHYDGGLRYQDIDDEVLSKFRAHLLKLKVKSGKAVSGETIRRYLGAPRAVLASITKGPLKSIAQRISERVPAGPVDSHLTSIPTPILSIHDLLSIMEAAEREFLNIEARFLRGRELVMTGTKKLKKGSRNRGIIQDPKPSFDIVLAALNATYPAIIPHVSVINVENPPLGAAIAYCAKEYEKISLARYFYPSSRDLVCFVLLITIVTVFNPDTALWLKWGNISLDKDVAGIPMIEIIGEKDRAPKNLVRLLDPNDAISSGLSLSRVLRFIQNFTNRARPFAAEGHADFVFLFVQDGPRINPKSWGALGATFEGPSADAVWKFSLKKFISENNLPRFTLAQLRPTILNLVQTLNGSLEAAAQVGNHGNVRTTWTSYTSDGIRKEYRERIGQILLLRERWFDSEGRIDPRIRTAHADKGAATPGFICVDPFASPRPNEAPGRLCSDYGGCPACPLAGAFPDDPESVAYYTALVDAIYQSQGVMSAQTWLNRWTPVLSDLQSLLDLVPNEVLIQSKQIVVRLPLVG